MSASMQKGRPKLRLEFTKKLAFYIGPSQPSKLKRSSFKVFTKPDVERHFGVVRV